MDGIKKKSFNERYQLGASAKSIARRAAIAGVSGGLGKAAQKAVEATAYDTMSRGAEAAAKKARLRNAKKRKAKALQERNKRPEKKLTGISFYGMLTLAAAKDALDVFLTFSIIFSFLIIITGLLITFLIMFYLFYNRVKFTTKKLVTVTISMLIEMLPVLGILPMTTVNLILIRMFENSKNAKKLTDKAGALVARFT